MPETTSAKQPSIAKAVVVGGIIGGLIGGIVFFGLLISGAIAGYMAKRGAVGGAGVGFLSGVVSFVIGLIIILFVPYILASVIGLAGAGSTTSPQVSQAAYQLANTIRSVLGIGYLLFFIATPIGGLIGGFLAKKKQK
ncbi:MAG: hypothetical protein KGI00_02620 [Candidatus Micrarchaeota archaeon]|nr:hypothetical protein [Candidatus Micrarchaeota archaeon]MDE1849600.1 hypothetical protein [Candidatus Micrarchaeota archaeon]